ncbi:hypothetical protein [Methylorubrum extorquens]|uniref:hypothetical protein n=1 Tax=Methylorubrum extorquens TaxID=408 RepID=UPI0020A0BB15|nr:hypothetical protein [Methylorubrum extorquens]MCP1554325.1 hypothetical protein [Methylorubrum extorquens]
MRLLSVRHHVGAGQTVELEEEHRLSGVEGPFETAVADERAGVAALIGHRAFPLQIGDRATRTA